MIPVLVAAREKVLELDVFSSAKSFSMDNWDDDETVSPSEAEQKPSVPAPAGVGG